MSECRTAWHAYESSAVRRLRSVLHARSAGTKVWCGDGVDGNVQQQRARAPSSHSCRVTVAPEQQRLRCALDGLPWLHHQAPNTPKRCQTPASHALRHGSQHSQQHRHTPSHLGRTHDHAALAPRIRRARGVPWPRTTPKAHCSERPRSRALRGHTHSLSRRRRPRILARPLPTATPELRRATTRFGLPLFAAPLRPRRRTGALPPLPLVLFARTLLPPDFAKPEPSARAPRPRARVMVCTLAPLPAALLELVMSTVPAKRDGFSRCGAHAQAVRVTWGGSGGCDAASRTLQRTMGHRSMQWAVCCAARRQVWRWMHPGIGVQAVREFKACAFSSGGCSETWARCCDSVRRADR